MKSSFKAFAAMLLAAMFLTACGGDDDPVVAATANTAVAITPANGPAVIAAVASQPFVFSSGVPAFGTTSTTTLTITSTSTATTPTFSIASAQGTATGTMSFGSCKFTIVSATGALASQVGQTITITPCTVTVATVGVTADNANKQSGVALILAAAQSGTTQQTITVSSTGTVSVNGVVVGGVVVANVTGT